MRQTENRVVVTGIGSVTAYGVGVEAFWQGMVEKPPAIRRITQFDASTLPVQIAAEVEGFDPLLYMDKRMARRCSRFTQFGVAAAQEALQDAGYKASRDEEIGVFLGTAGGVFDTSDQAKRLETRGPGHVDPLFIARIGAHMASARVGLMLGLRGPNSTFNSACASGLDAIAQAASALRLGHAHAILAGGAEAVISPIALATMGLIGALTKSYNQDPQRASRPFDKERDGFVLGEGAGVLLLERLDAALARDARIYCEVLGAGWSFDATDDTAPDVEGQWLAMHRALRDAQIGPDEIDAVKAHATSTVLNDRTETAALKRLLGERAFQVPVTAPKSKVGHAASAAGAVETVLAVMMLQRQTLVPTANLEHPDPECDLDYVAEGPRSSTVDTMLVDAFGMGGQNASLVLRRWEGC